MTESKENESKNSTKEANQENAESSSISNVADDDTAGQIGKGVGVAPVSIDREEYLQSCREFSYDLRQLQLKNNILHRRLAEYYKKRKLEHVLKQLDGAIDLEEKYQQKLFSYEELKEKEEREISEIKSKVSKIRTQYLNRLENAEKNFDNLQTIEKNTGIGLIYSMKGKPISDKTVMRFLTLQKRKSEQSSALCLKYIRLRNAVNELEDITRKLEMLGPGLYVAHYEQLCLDNQNYLTKIEEREDELIKNRSKCTERNQILAHIREKMNHTDEVIEFAEADLGKAEMTLLQARAELGEVKNRRDKLRWSVEEERVKAGLLTRNDLLLDFQNANDEVVRLRERRQQLEQEIIKTTCDLRKTGRRVQLHNATTNNQA
ncbi:hypothetical protein ACJJTC_003906 [Scirpophaga incertulas]